MEPLARTALDYRLAGRLGVATGVVLAAASALHRPVVEVAALWVLGALLGAPVMYVLVYRRLLHRDLGRAGPAAADRRANHAVHARPGRGHAALALRRRCDRRSRDRAGRGRHRGRAVAGAMGAPARRARPQPRRRMAPVDRRRARPGSAAVRAVVVEPA